MTRPNITRCLGELSVMGCELWGFRSSVLKSIGGSKQVLSHRNMRDQHIRHILNRPVVPPLKTLPVRIGLEERARLVEQRFTIRRRRVVGRQQLVDLHHQPRERMQPREPRVVEHQAKQRTASLDSPLLTLVPDAGILQERLVHTEKAASQLLELSPQVG